MLLLLTYSVRQATSQTGLTSVIKQMLLGQENLHKCVNNIFVSKYFFLLLWGTIL